MLCPNCGNELKSGSSFCEKCGTKIDTNSARMTAVQKKKPFFILALILAAAILTILAGKLFGASAGGDLSGYYTDGKTYSTFPISALEFYEDGTVTFHMDHTYYGEYSGKNGAYKLTVKEASNEFGANLTVKEVKNGLRITAEKNEDGSLTVYVKSKIGYMYMGPESEVFHK